MLIATCARAYPGHPHCGDTFLVATVRPGERPRCLLRSDQVGDGEVRLVEVEASTSVLLAVVDGVGHGRPAHDAAALVIDAVLGDCWRDAVGLVQACHRRAAPSRGATAAFALLHAGRQLTAIGVGDVRLEMRGASGTRSFATNAGTLGHNLPAQPFVERCRVEKDTALFLCSDGIAESFGLESLPDVATGDPRATLERIMTTHSRAADDAAAVLASLR